MVDRLMAADPDLLQSTRHVLVDLTDETSVADATAWWTELTEAGGEGMVVKPLAALVKGNRGLVQPGIKCRGREYLRIIYGPDYTEPANLEQLRQRGLGRTHEAVFAILALETEPIDPRL